MRNLPLRSVCSAIVLLGMVACSPGTSDPTPRTPPPPPALVLVTTTLPAGTVGTPYKQGVQVTGGTGNYLWSVKSGALPDGVTLNTATGELSGLPTTDGAFTFTLSVIDAGQSLDAPLAISIARPEVASVKVLDLPELLIGNASAQLSLRILGPGGGALSGLPIVWTTSDPMVASVTPGGVVTAHGSGRVTITASVYGHQGAGSVLAVPRPTRVSLGTWQSIGPTNIPGFHPGILESGKLQAVARSPSNPLVIYMGGGIGVGGQGPWTEPGAFRSSNGGVSWTPINGGLSDRVVNTLWVDPANPNIVLAGTERAGIFRSTNGGGLWAKVFTGGPVSELISVPGGLLAAAGSGVLFSIDGTNWTMVQPTSRPVRTVDQVGGVILAGLEDGRVLRQVGSGAPWATVSHAIRDVSSVAIDPTNPSVMFAIMTFTGADWVQRSVDGGTTWSTIPNPCGLPQVLTFAPGSSTLFLGCNGSLRKSVTGGASWTTVPGSGWDIRRVFVENDGTIFLGTDQGVHSSGDDGASWSGLTGGTSTSIIVGLAIRGDNIIASVQDFSPIVSFDAGGSWLQPVTGPGGLIGEGGLPLINPYAPSNCYFVNGNGFQYSQDGCQTWTWPNKLITGFPYIQPGSRHMIAVDANQPARIYVVTSTGLKRSENHGATFASVPGPFPDATVVAVDPFNSDVLIVGSTSGLYRSIDRGITWIQPSLPPVAGFPAAVQFHPTVPDLILVADSRLPRYGGGVLRSLDAGATFKLVNGGYNPPDANVRVAETPTLAINSDGVIAYSNTEGVHISFDLGGTWEDITPAGISWILDVEWSGDALFASTAGSGIMKAQSTGSGLLRLPGRPEDR